MAAGFGGKLLLQRGLAMVEQQVFVVQMSKEKRFCRNGSNRGCRNIGREKSRMNEKKFTEVFNKYNRLVRKMVISRSGNDMLAEEICQQVFLQYFEHADVTVRR